MKSAEEWHAKYRKDEGWVYPHIDDIRAIQADALRHAARVCDSATPGLDRYEAIQECNMRLLAEAAKLTEGK